MIEKTNFIEAGCREFSRLIPKSAPDIQRIEMRRSFYAGVVWLMSELKHVQEHGFDALLDYWGILENELCDYVEEMRREHEETHAQQADDSAKHDLQR